MKNIYSNILKIDDKNISKAIKNLKKNATIGIPTETVYGLAGNAYSEVAVKKIYQLKKRPLKNPLIIHYHNIKDMKKDADINTNFIKLYLNFCPGPLTFVLNKKKNSKVNNLATSNLKTIAVRFPRHRVIRKVLRQLKFPLAIPSANISGGISPVSAFDVEKEFGKKIKLILNGGTSRIGIESTVIDLTKKIKILRPGAVNLRKIEEIINSKVFYSKNNKKISSPGLLRKHYSPGIPMKLNKKVSEKNSAFIIFGKNYKKTKHTFNLSKNSNLKEAAKNLYKYFRKIKEKGYKKINVVKIPNKDIGIAINDRLKRASY